MIMCACILHNLLIDHSIPQDWMDDNMEAEEYEELEQHHKERVNQRDQILLICWKCANSQIKLYHY